jgi:hypothetical protein
MIQRPRAVWHGGLIVALLMLSHASAATLVPNGSFEADVVTGGNSMMTSPSDWWVSYGGPEVNLYRPAEGDPFYGQIPDGAQAVRLLPRDEITTIDTGIYMTPGTGIRVFVDAVYFNETAAAGFQINGFGTSSLQLASFVPNAPTDGFSTFTYEYVPDAADSGNPFNFQIFNKTPSKEIMLDNVRYEEYTPPVKPERPGPVAGGPVIVGGTTPYAWYRADVGVDTYIGDDTWVAWWEDRSGNSRHMESTGKPLLTTNGVDGRTVVSFAGADAFVSTKAEWGEAAPGTVFAVWRQTQDAVGGTCYVYDAEADEQRELMTILTTGDGRFAEVGGSVYVPPSSWTNHYTAAPALEAPDVDTWVVSSASHTTGVTDTVRFNGEEVFSGDLLSGGMSGLRIGRFVLDRNYWKGDICELVVFEGELSATEREAIEQALMDRWGIIATPPPLPGDANNDGYIDDKDASILGSHWLASGANWSMGDFNKDGQVNDKDAAILAAHWTGPPAEDASVPEPTSLALLLGGLSWLVAIRHRLA